jgi:hypothetical protein
MQADLGLRKKHSTQGTTLNDILYEQINSPAHCGQGLMVGGAGSWAADDSKQYLRVNLPKSEWMIWIVLVLNSWQCVSPDAFTQ